MFALNDNLVSVASISIRVICNIPPWKKPALEIQRYLAEVLMRRKQILRVHWTGCSSSCICYLVRVTFELTAESDHSYLILGGMLRSIAVACIGFHEWKRSQEGESRNQSMVEDYKLPQQCCVGPLHQYGFRDTLLSP